MRLLSGAAGCPTRPSPGRGLVRDPAALQAIIAPPGSDGCAGDAPLGAGPRSRHGTGVVFPFVVWHGRRGGGGGGDPMPEGDGLRREHDLSGIEHG